ncbi:HD domain-containing protein [Microbacterium sp. P01]|uniref:HD domain-containing protein n=1 Tax=Microbacterium sp. P01 TaxID=3366261 RepID=UPI00366C5E96
MTSFDSDETIDFSGNVAEYQCAIEQWSEQLLRPYLNWLQGPGSGRRSAKQFNDAVWGTIVVQPQEVVVLDSPLVQRLRRIRQLGVVHLVYAGANHSRFEHSLGVMHQVSQLVGSINRSEDGQSVIGGDETDTLRLAGLLHDVGHGLMSHVVENALWGEDSTEDLRVQFGKQIRRSSKPQLSEMAAYFMIASPAVEELLSAAYGATSKQPPTNLGGTIARIVAGKRVSNSLPILHELISGPFDADKLDYMPRDARMCGVPVVTDVVRLTQKVRSVTVSTDKLPEQMARASGIRESAGGHNVFGIARSGASALDEVSLNRSLMFDKVYRHHKVRAVEAMVGATVQILLPVWGPDVALMPLKMMDDQFVELTLEDLERLNRDAGDPVGGPDLDVARDILGRIRDRHLFSRAFAFAATMPGDAYRDDTVHEAAREQFIRELDQKPEKRAAFVAATVKQVDKIGTLLNDRQQIDLIGVGNLHHYIRVDPPSTAGRGSQYDQSRAYLVDESNHLIPVEKERSENRPWADAYVNTKDVGYVFAPREIASLVHIAAEVTARMLYDVRIPQQMHNYAKMGGEALANTRRQLEAQGYFEDLPRDLAPLPTIFGLAEAKQRVARTLTNLRGYMGPTHRVTSPGPSGSTLNETRILGWAAQFPERHHMNALRVAESIRMIDRDAANEALREFEEAHPEFAGAHYVPMGENKDGSAVLGYFQRDSEPDTGYELSDIVNALRSAEPIVFVDDFVGLGRSSKGIFQSYMGLDGGKETNERRTVTLTEDEREILKARKVALVWETGFEAGATATADVLRELGISDVTTYIRTRAESLPTVWSALDGVENDEVEAFVEECRRIGRQLLPDDTKPELIEERLLGYGGYALLLTNSYNTPTVTLTALALSGTVDGREWNALIPRRKKD